ncbi:MAG: lipid-A-disaccharide synthase N-terminal domain-containing protein [Planctomycetota bacterium]
MKAGPVFAMVGLIALGAWLVYQGRSAVTAVDASPGAVLHEAEIAGVRGYIEHEPEAGKFRFFARNDERGAWLERAAFVDTFGEEATAHIEAGGHPALFRLFNISSWSSVVWVGLGFLAQAIFAARFLVQWIVSERKRASVVPDIFWWISLVGGISLFVYFVWRRDIVGVFGQSSGIVIYARNLRLIGKQKRREARAAERQPEPETPAESSDA